MKRERRHAGKHRWGMLSLMLLLVSAAACGSQTNADMQTEVIAETAAADTQTAVNTGVTDDPAETSEETDKTLSELFVQVDGQENLYMYTGTVPQEEGDASMLLFGNQLLLWSEVYSEAETGTVFLYLLDPSAGEITAKSGFSCVYISDVSAGKESILVADSGSGLVVELDDVLNSVYVWTPQADHNAWYVYAEDRLLYQIDDAVLMKTELLTEDAQAGTALDGDFEAIVAQRISDYESGVYDDDAVEDEDRTQDSSAEVLLSSSISLYGSLAANGGVDISYVDEETQWSWEVWLDLASGTISAISDAGACDWLTMDTAGRWLACLYGMTSGTRYSFGTDETASVVYIESGEGSLSQPEGGDYLLYEAGESADLVLYDYTGEAVASCSPGWDGNGWFYYSGCVYSETYDGYFLLASTQDGAVLYFWDLSGLTREDDGSTAAGTEESAETADAAETADTLMDVSADLYVQAEALSEAYGVEIRIAEQCSGVYDGFYAELCTQEEAISTGLDVLADTLASFPDGFLQQLSYQQVRSIRIELTGALTAEDADWGEENYNGLTQVDGDTYVMVIDLYQLETGTFYHEFSHIIDSKLDWDSYCRSDALFSEETWESLNPEDFSYVYVYDGFSSLELNDAWAGYFIDTYAMVSPTEDRARIFEYAATGDVSVFADADALLLKLAYYCDCIRDAFDTDGWPEATVWEEALQY